MTARLVTDALVMAIWRRGKPDALLHHSDRGSQYTSEQFQKLTADHGARGRARMCCLPPFARSSTGALSAAVVRNSVVASSRRLASVNWIMLNT
jgi:Integrase core domain